MEIISILSGAGLITVGLQPIIGLHADAVAIFPYISITRVLIRPAGVQFGNAARLLLAALGRVNHALNCVLRCSRWRYFLEEI